MIYHVVSGLKHNGTVYPAGTFIEMEEGAFPDLVAYGVLVAIPGANNVEEASAAVEAQKQADEAAAAEADAVKPQDTWAAKPDPVVSDEVQSEPEVTTDVPPEDPTTQPEVTTETPPEETGDNL